MGRKLPLATEQKVLSYKHPHVLRPIRRCSKSGAASLAFLSQPRRQRRSGEWTPGRAVTFIVTVAATRSVTLAAREAGMSRKSAYALKGRDSAFAADWNAALRPPRRQGDKVDEVEEPPVSSSQGDSRPRSAPSSSSTADRHADVNFDADRRAMFFAGLCESPSLAPGAAAQ